MRKASAAAALQRAPSIPKSPRPRRVTHAEICKSHSMNFADEVSSISPLPPAVRAASTPQPSPLVIRRRSSSIRFQRENECGSPSMRRGSGHLDMEFAIPFSLVADCHSRDLPLQVKISGSLYGVCGTASLVDGDTINLHFLKETSCVRVMMTENREVTVPFNSSLEFSPLYKPTGDLADAMDGREFLSVADLMSADPLPLVICVKGQQHKISSQLASGDVLVLKKLKRKGLLSASYIECHNVQRNVDVKLTENTRAQFSTEPHLVKLRLPQLIKHIELPQEVMVSHHDDSQWSQLHPCFPNNMCTLLSSTTETSFIASYSKKEISSALLEIPTTFSCQVQIKTVSTLTKQQLLDETTDLLKKFQPKMVNVYISEKISSKYEHVLRRCICDDNWREGVVLKIPDNVEDSEDQYEYLPFAVTQFKPDEEREEELIGLKNLVGQLQQKVNTLEKARPVEEPEDPYVVMRSASTSTTVNKEALGLLTCDQVQQLLDAMKLGEYKPKFESEQINGDIMLELDESILEQELGVKTRIHRIRLMKIISGSYPVGNYLKQDEGH